MGAKSLQGEPEKIAEALVILIQSSETLSKQVLALSNLSALLLREICLAHPEPLQHFAKVEAEIGGLGEAIAVGTRKFTDVAVSSEAITDVFEQVLRQARSLIESRTAERRSTN